MIGSLSVTDFMPDSVDGISTFAQAVAQMEAGQTYVNIHSLDYPAGEIRGQIVSNSEPASYGLLLLGIVLVGLGERRRRSAMSVPRATLTGRS